MGNFSSTVHIEAGEGDSLAKPATPPVTPMRTVVRKEAVIAKRGSIPVSGRYTCSRELEQDYTLLETVLGTGMNGSVCMAEGKADGRRYAVKSFKKSGLSLKNRQDLKNEVELYLQLSHPHIAHLHMVFETEEAVHLVMELMEGGELYDRLASQKRYTESAAADAVYQTLLAVAYLHAQKIAHRDLKLENFLYQSKDADLVKLIDFGLAKFWDPSTRMSQACGSIHYVAPEVLFQSYTVQADMWSVGIIAYMLLTGTPAFHGPDRDILRKIKAGRPHYSSRFGKLSSQAQAFVQELLVADPSSRLTAAQALEHPWIQERHLARTSVIDSGIVGCLRTFAGASRFRRAALCMMSWSLSTEEQMELREQFLLMDVQKRGSIKLNELKAILRDNFHVDGAEAERLFSMLDCDNSHEIEYNEFLAAALVGHVNAHEDLLRRTFSRFDRDESGLISQDELREVLGDNFEGEDIEELMRAVDTSGDGQIDYDEFMAYFQKPEQDLEADQPELARRSSRTRHTQKLGAVIDRLAASEQAADANDPSLQRRLDRRCKTAPLALPVLLGTKSTSSTGVARTDKA